MLILILDHHILGAQSQTLNKNGGVIHITDQNNWKIPLGAANTLKDLLCWQDFGTSGCYQHVPVALAQILLQLPLIHCQLGLYTVIGTAQNTDDSIGFVMGLFND